MLLDTKTFINGFFQNLQEWYFQSSRKYKKSISFAIHFTSVTFYTITWKGNSVTENFIPSQAIQLIH